MTYNNGRVRDAPAASPARLFLASQPILTPFEFRSSTKPAILWVAEKKSCQLRIAIVAKILF